MNIFIVYAHHEPRSFNAALLHRAVAVLGQAGHEVVVSDLYAMGWNPVSDRRNFTTVRDPQFLKQQQEELYASQHAGFAPDIAAEIEKLERCDALIFQAPLWWFGLPGILKGWVDRVFAMGRVYGGGRWYENGVGQGHKRALLSMTTGGSESMFSGRGVNPSMQSVLAPIQHGIFWFNGFLPLPPFLAWGAGRTTDEGRAAYLHAWEQRLAGLFTTRPALHLPTTEFDREAGLLDRARRYMARWTMKAPPDAEVQALIPREVAEVQRLRDEGVVLDIWLGADGQSGYLLLRGASAEALEERLRGLPLWPHLQFELHELR